MASSTRFGVEAATGQPQTAATGAFTDELTEAIGRSVKHLLSLQASEGYWLGELEADTTLESDYIFYLHILDKADPQRVSKLANYIRQHQLPDGGWNIYFGGPSELNATVKAYFALKLAGDRPDQAHMQRACARVLELGGLESTNSYTRFYLALVGAVVWEMAPAIPPELMLLPSWFAINIYEMSSWTRGIVIPLAIVYAHKPDWRLREPVRVDELFRDPHYAARGNIARVSDPRAGDLAVPNVVPRLTDTPGGVDTLGPGLGQHNAEVYGRLLGMTGADLRTLEDEGVI